MARALLNTWLTAKLPSSLRATSQSVERVPVLELQSSAIYSSNNNNTINRRNYRVERNRLVETQRC